MTSCPSWLYVDEPGMAHPVKHWTTGAMNSPGEFLPWAPALELGLGCLF